MVEINELRNNYNSLYASMRAYTWSFSTIELLADLEIEVYKAFPDVSRLSLLLSRLKMCALTEYREDDDIKESFDSFEDTLNNNEDVYVKLDRVQEVINR